MRKCSAVYYGVGMYAKRQIASRGNKMNAAHIIGLLFLAMALATLFSREPLASVPVAIIGVLLMFGNTKRPI